MNPAISAYQNIADDAKNLTVSTLSNSSLGEQDLQELLQFLVQVNAVLHAAFEPSGKALSDTLRLREGDIGGPEHRQLVADLHAMQDRRFYNSMLVCNQLHGLRHHAQKHIEQLVRTLPNAGDWWSLFSQIDDQEGYVQHLVSQQVRTVTDELESVQDPASLERVQIRARELGMSVQATLADMEEIKNLLHQHSGRAGFRSLTQSSRELLAQRLTTVHHTYHQEHYDISDNVFHGQANIAVGVGASASGNSSIVLNKTITVDRVMRSLDEVKLAVQGDRALAADDKLIATSQIESIKNEVAKASPEPMKISKKMDALVSILKGAGSVVTESTAIGAALAPVAQWLGTHVSKWFS